MSKRILVVEDQEDNRKIIRDMLSATDYEIAEAENGEEALAAVAKQRPDLILMDIQMPDLGWLRGDTADQGRSSTTFHPDHRDHLLCLERRRTKGEAGWLR
jgi:CheY-like chemotaxis protein